MPISKIIFYLFLADAALQLISAATFREWPRRISKVLLLPLLLAHYLYGAENADLFVTLACCFGWAGDALLIRSDINIVFLLGMFSFLAGHICYIIVYTSLCVNFLFPAFFISAGIALVLGIVYFRFLKPPGHMIFPVILYETAILGMSILALQLLLTHSIGTAPFIFAGSLLFILSDSMLAYFSFHSRPKYGTAIIMLPYMMAQALIILSL